MASGAEASLGSFDQSIHICRHTFAAAGAPPNSPAAHLGVVKVRQARRRQALGDRHLERLLLNGVPQQPAGLW